MWHFTHCRRLSPSNCLFRIFHSTLNWRLVPSMFNNWLSRVQHKFNCISVFKLESKQFYFGCRPCVLREVIHKNNNKSMSFVYTFLDVILVIVYNMYRVLFKIVLLFLGLNLYGEVSENVYQKTIFFSFYGWPPLIIHKIMIFSFINLILFTFF